MSRAQPPLTSPGRYPCAFDLALLAGCAGCSYSEKTPVGEQILVYCRARDPAERCHTWLGRLQENASFAIPGVRGTTPMTHAQAMQLRCGGLRGLAGQAGWFDDGSEIDDIAQLVAQLPYTSKDPGSIAWDRVMREITAWRRPSRRGRG